MKGFYFLTMFLNCLSFQYNYFFVILYEENFLKNQINCHPSALHGQPPAEHDDEASADTAARPGTASTAKLAHVTVDATAATAATTAHGQQPVPWRIGRQQQWQRTRKQPVQGRRYG